MLKEISEVFGEYLEAYEEFLLETRHAEFLDGEEPDGSESIDSELLEYTAKLELSYAISDTPSYMDYVDMSKAKDTISDVVGEASEYIEDLRGKLPDTTPMYRVINTLVSEMDAQEKAHGWRDAVLAFEKASEKSAFKADFQQMIMEY